MSFADFSDAVTLSMLDTSHPLATYSKHAFTLDAGTWPSLEHYVQAMQFEDALLRAEIGNAPHPALARQLARRRRRLQRKDWALVRVRYMTRGAYIKACTHAEVATALLATANRPIIETSQYDYFWGCGRDTRGHNHYGRVLMQVRSKLQANA